MSPGIILVIAILVLSLLIVIIAGIMTYKKAKPTLENIKHTQEKMTDKMALYNREVNHVNERVNGLNDRVQLIQKDVEIKSEQFQNLTDEQGQFQTSLKYLKEHAGEYGSGIASNLKDELKEDGPKLAEIFKRAFKKTANKQKVRLQK